MERARRGRKPAPSRKADVLSFVDFVKKVNPRFNWSRHNLLLAKRLQQIADGELHRLIVLMPVRHGKSELVSRLFPAYYLYRHPTKEVGLACSTASLAEDLSSEARNYYIESGSPLSRDTASKTAWKTRARGGMWAAGVDGTVYGKGYHLGIIDDPFKNDKEASSRGVQESVQNFWRSTWSSRKAPGAAQILVCTRWNENDLAGFILDLEQQEAAKGADGLPQCWHIVDLPAVCDLDDTFEYPTTCTVEKEWRQHGEALDPSRYDLKALNQERTIQGEYFWAALYQQRPRPAGGTVLHREWFRHRIHISQVPVMVVKVLGADIAWTAKTQNDRTCAFPLGRDSLGRYYLFRPFLEHVESPDAIRGIATHALSSRVSTIGVEAVGGQRSICDHLRERDDMAGIAIVEIPRGTGDKLVMTREWAPVAEQGNITLVDDGTGWIETFLTEAVNFPNGKHDDQVDGVSMAFRTMRNVALFDSAGGAPVGSTPVARSLRA